MSQPVTPLSEQEQQQLVRQIGRAMLPVVPQGWQRIRAEYRAAGRHIEVDLAFAGPDGQLRPVRPPMDVVQMFGQLRAGMYHPDRGTWLHALYEIEAPAAFTVDFNAEDEPRWRNAPPPIGFRDELQTFPRPDQLIPDWWRQRVGLPPLPAPEPEPQQAHQQTGELRTARVYDGKNDDGRIIVNRPPIDPQLVESLLAYLESAPVVLAARSYDLDEFSQGGEQDVPLNFRTDGTWIWAGAVPHYLRKYGLPPEPELVAHVVARGFQVGEVPEQTQDRAVQIITGQGQG
ncbi:hypothetical protein SAMN05216188_10385 [Lentzea xinjiangensis]|uniref:SseB protein N-terminal domain-containing protein n=1 Tax=Lentzea xinjiangensis TaxID=402600 RepID=A0A1H9G5E3_9PSEU|nr:hypothetical protein [Lentzea xinjiangensis]SEQ45292.1 hypothetical protein SAMN05216188_10385 [Lentzea xinjiangensis]